MSGHEEKRNLAAAGSNTAQLPSNPKITHRKYTGNTHIMIHSESDEMLPNHCSNQPITDVDMLSEELPEHLRDMLKSCTKYLEGEQPQQSKKLIERHPTLLSKTKLDIGKVTGVKHDIDTRNSHPLSQPMRRLPIHQQDKANKQVREMLKA
jgi:ribosome-binding ATPase YchF (GTP1/OBG family)